MNETTNETTKLVDLAFLAEDRVQNVRSNATQQEESQGAPRFTRAFKSADDAFTSALRVERERKGITQEDVAREMARRGFDFHQQTVYKIESGRRKVTVGEALALAEIVSATVESLADQYPDSPESLARNARRSGRDLAEALFDLAGRISALRDLKKEYAAAVHEYSKAPAMQDLQLDAGKSVPMDQAFAVLAAFPGLADYSIAWRELLANQEAIATLKAVGWDPAEMDESEYL